MSAMRKRLLEAMAQKDSKRQHTRTDNPEPVRPFSRAYANVLMGKGISIYEVLFHLMQN